MKFIELKEKERQKLLFKHSLIFPIFFICLIWLMFFLQEYGDVNMNHWGIYPLETKGLKGILLSPLVHRDISHLISNSIPLFVLLWAVFYFYRTLAYRIFFLSYIFSGIWIWFGAREGWHIGASGLVYAFAAFTFVSGVIRKRKEYMALALVIVFLYGDLIWGMFPMTKDTDISFEGHFLGAIAGITLAIYFKNENPKKKNHILEEEKEEEDENIDYYIKDDNTKDEKEDFHNN